MTSADLDDLSLAESLLPFALHFARDPFGAFHIEKTNAPFMYTLKATGPEFGAGIKHAVERGWLELHESGTYVRLMKTDTANWEPAGLVCS